MAVSAPTRPRSTGAIPYAESQPQPAIRRASPDWLLVIGWFVDDGLRHSRINVIPLGNTVDPHERFAGTAKFFSGSDEAIDMFLTEACAFTAMFARGREEPIHTFLSEPFSGDDTFRYESTDLLQAIGQRTFE